ncbi:hypothetical protein [Rhodovulum adriaticum]|uniref:Uncharacterized protein n=1 Tax=Rhodovulum adriaticum TaxID=35804 RepID=A0A4R2NZP5_RHOAD|nr:hypothetical protein [Rhodovulum adriaticum]MBK1634211.1 hypothetical protein [Rhodovulum adriaticum]TCP27238.1 hypothetical protein EV656_101141 [Rhodovulum adriaticum]
MRITYDIWTGTFAFDTSGARPFGANIEARLDRHGQVVAFDGLSFGMVLSRNGAEALRQTFPPPGVRYVSTDQDLLTSVPVRWRPDEAITLDVWMTNEGTTVAGTHAFVAPRPAQPWPSWIWDAGKARWMAPVAYPQDGGVYDWDEASGQWVAAPS